MSITVSADLVLPDTSVWIEFHRPRPSINLAPLQWLLEERRAATCRPVVAEILSGTMSSKVRSLVTAGMVALVSVDPDWNDEAV